jgi:hypothetical protein
MGRKRSSEASIAQLRDIRDGIAGFIMSGTMPDSVRGMTLPATVRVRRPTVMKTNAVLGQLAAYYLEYSSNTIE